METTEENGQIELSVVRGEASGLFSLRPTSLVMSEDTTFEQWCEILKTIKWIHKNASIGMADCIAFGVKKWGKAKVEDALEQLEFEALMVRTAVAISSIPQEMRFPNLKSDHYVELAKANLTKPKAIRWARIASEQELTPSQLRFSIAENEVVDKAAVRAMGSGVITIQGIRQSFDVWLNRVGGFDGIKKMDIDHQNEIMEELTAILNFGLELASHMNAQNPTQPGDYALNLDPA